uniref:Uncharacterized protein n=1 Tax=Trichobilharzia regenti TaxID=157069 RepID=A0AA85JN62_TRIRE|nr:unnamed protein product [Trichobilharzia regenti]
MPEVKVITRISTRGSLEIKYNGILIFSKLEVGGFPKLDPLVEALKSVVNGATPQMVTECYKPSYCILI